jgi:hypothetical protein
MRHLHDQYKNRQNIHIYKTGRTIMKKCTWIQCVALAALALTLAACGPLSLSTPAPPGFSLTGAPVPSGPSTIKDGGCVTCGYPGLPPGHPSAKQSVPPDLPPSTPFTAACPYQVSVASPTPNQRIQVTATGGSIIGPSGPQPVQSIPYTPQPLNFIVNGPVTVSAQALGMPGSGDPLVSNMATDSFDCSTFNSLVLVVGSGVDGARHDSEIDGALAVNGMGQPIDFCIKPAFDDSGNPISTGVCLQGLPDSPSNVIWSQYNPPWGDDVGGATNTVTVNIPNDQGVPASLMPPQPGSSLTITFIGGSGHCSGFLDTNCHTPDNWDLGSLMVTATGDGLPVKTLINDNSTGCNNGDNYLARLKTGKGSSVVEFRLPPTLSTPPIYVGGNLDGQSSICNGD